MQNAVSICDTGLAVSHAQWWMLIVADYLTGKDTRRIASLVCRDPLLLQLCVQSQRNRLSSSVWTVSATYGDGGVIIGRCWLVRLHGCVAIRGWHLFCYLYVTINHTAVCHTNRPTTRSLFIAGNHFSLCTEMVQKLYSNRPPSCTKVVWAESACIACTEIGQYRSRPSRPEVDTYRSGHTPKLGVTTI